MSFDPLCVCGASWVPMAQHLTGFGFGFVGALIGAAVVLASMMPLAAKYDNLKEQLGKR